MSTKIPANQRKRGVLFPLLTLFCLLAGLQTATQMLALEFDYNQALGRHYAHVYLPWSIVSWAVDLYEPFPDAVMKAGSAGLTVCIFGLFSLMAARVMVKNTARASDTLHGSARWATRTDIEKAGLLAAKNPYARVTRWMDSLKTRADNRLDGWLFGKQASVEKVATARTGKKSVVKPKPDPFVYVGAWQDDKNGKVYYLRHSGPEHVLCFAPTRSGKGVGLVVPTLLSWSASAVITDLKGELWAMTSGWRKQSAGNRVLRFEPASLSSVHWNPLDEIRLEPEYEVGDVQNLVTLIVDPDGKGLNDHWQKTAFALLVGVILHVLYNAKNDPEAPRATLTVVDNVLANPNREIAELWKEMKSTPHLAGNGVHPVVAAAAQDMADRPDEEAGSVLSTAKSYLSLYRDPVVAQNISESQFRIRDLMHHDNPVSLYIVTSPTDKGRLRPLVRVLVSMIVRLLADRMDFKDGRPVAHYKHRLLMMLDEFPSLGKLEVMQESLAFVAGYGIKCYLICQDLTQLKDRNLGYGPDESITSNCHIQNAYPPNKLETAEHLSRLTGQTTVIKEQITTSGKRAGLLMGQVSKTFQEVQRPLLTADEALRMKGPEKNQVGEILEAGDMVIYVAGFPAIYGKQPLYFKDPVFLRRAQIAAPDKSDVLRNRAARPTATTPPQPVQDTPPVAVEKAENPDPPPASPLPAAEAVTHAPV